MITFFTAYLGGTHGTAKSARDFIRALLACHGSVRVLAPAQELFPERLCDTELSTPEWLIMPKGIKPPHKLNEFNITRIIEWLKDVRALRCLRSSEMVIVNGWASYALWQVVKDSFSGLKVMVVRESPRHFNGPDRNHFPPDLLSGFSSFDHLIFVSERVCYEWRQYAALSSKPYSVLYNCCEEEVAAERLAGDRSILRAKYGFSPDNFVVLCPGTIEHRKGQDLLLKIVPSLREAIPHLRILYVGDVATEWGQNFIQSIADSNLENTVTHWHAQPDLFDLLHVADVLAFPSRAEALPRTILEAMAMKTPVVASSVDGIPELIENGRTGLLFECDDSEGLFNGIMLLYSNPALRNQYAEAGFSRYWNIFSREHQFKRMKVILNVIETL